MLFVPDVLFEKIAIHVRSWAILSKIVMTNCCLGVKIIDWWREFWIDRIKPTSYSLSLNYIASKFGDGRVGEGYYLEIC